MTAPGDVQVILSDRSTAHIIKNLYPLYLHDLSEFGGVEPNEHGVLEPTPVRSLADQAEIHDIWWKHPGTLFPFLFLVEGQPVGFELIATGKFVPAGVQFLVNEFFIARAFRRRGIGQASAVKVFNRFIGSWELHILPANVPAWEFWISAVTSYTAGRFDQGFTADGLRRLSFSNT
jgi:predicted acetyltransferase